MHDVARQRKREHQTENSQRNGWKRVGADWRNFGAAAELLGKLPGLQSIRELAQLQISSASALLAASL